MLIVTSALLRRTGSDGRPEVLVGLKKTGFGAGLVNYPGGKLEPGETPAEAVAREVAEETAMTVAVGDLKPAAELVFRFPDVPEWDDIRLHCFTATEFAGEPQESAEIATGWLAEAELPYDRMWDDSRLWVPPVLAGEYVVMDVIYAGRSKVASHTRLPSAAGLG
ncbi:8-oxo-dGTP diphosphatase [Catenulispora pinisilvae]|uniref:8-oxo-dGTP diphosphatase n=1 Tax=Catenulispora pinisilvae TaxID=2705253 RepID=UPI001890BB25|nr:NUDIX domain-containing protein [Catenulispora pinisilvae]